MGSALRSVHSEPAVITLTPRRVYDWPCGCVGVIDSVYESCARTRSHQATATRFAFVPGTFLRIDAGRPLVASARCRRYRTRRDGVSLLSTYCSKNSAGWTPLARSALIHFGTSSEGSERERIRTTFDMVVLSTRAARAASASDPKC